MTRIRELLSSKYVYRSADDGRYVSWLYAKLHPKTTYRTLRKRPDIEPMSDWP